MATKNIVLPIGLSSIDSSTFTGAYQLISPSDGIPAACVIVRFVNNCDKDVTISYDGVTDHDFLRDGTELVLDFQANAQPSALVGCMPRFTKIYVKGAAGTGSVYLTGYYNPQGI